jgi:hypothetical protein
MAKDDKNTQAVVTTEDNIMEEIRNTNLAEIDLGEKVMEEIKKEKDERKAREIKQRYLRADYNEKLAKVDMLHVKRLNDITRYQLTQSGRLRRLLMGFKVDKLAIEYSSHHEDDILNMESCDKKAGTITITTKSGKKTYKDGDKVPAAITVVEYDRALQTLADKIRNMKNEEDKQHSKDIDELDNSFGDYYVSSWRYFRW